MANENDFLAFAVGDGAFVLSQEDYAALAAIVTGYNSGTAVKEQLNKTWRQGSIAAYLLGQIIADAGLDALDNDDLATLLANLKSAIGAQTATPTIIAATGAVSQLTQNAIIRAGAPVALTLPVAPSFFRCRFQDGLGNADVNPVSFVGNINGVANPVLLVQPFQTCDIVWDTAGARYLARY